MTLSGRFLESALLLFDMRRVQWENLLARIH